MRQLSTAKFDDADNDGTWTVVHERELLSTQLGVSICEQTVQLPDATVVSDYLQITMPNYTTVLPVTCDGLIVCIRQYKHGIGSIALTLPGGAIESDELPIESARRELLEETGYRCANWQDLGAFVVGANQGICKAHLFLAKDGRKIREAESGDLEDMEIELLDVEHLQRALDAGQFPILSHSCAIALAKNYI